VRASGGASLRGGGSISAARRTGRLDCSDHAMAGFALAQTAPARWKDDSHNLEAGGLACRWGST
jgi:hypothetical protein